MNARNGPRRDMRVIKGGKLVCYELSLSLSLSLNLPRADGLGR
jgi:hypothetical protein